MTASSLINQLIAQGVDSFCIAPGSRSTPLVVAAKKHPQIKIHVHFDERGLGFFALGLAKATEKPIAVIVTSGTAVGNLLPAVMESFHSHTPLILLTADRPHELRDTGANQTCDQVKIFQNFVLWQFDLGLDLEEGKVSSIAAQGFWYAMQGGPVHINCPMRDPLYAPSEFSSLAKQVKFIFPKKTIAPLTIEKEKGIIFIGRLPKKEDVHPILQLAAKLKWPVFADILSNARLYPTKEQIRYFDWIQKPRPDLILHFGERMTSKKLLEWTKEIQTEYIHISPWNELQDPERLLSMRVQSDTLEFCKHFTAKKSGEWIQHFQDHAPLFEEVGAFTEVHAMKELSQILPPDFAVFLGNGMPIRDADQFLFPKSAQGFFANRGLSGIDGNIATIAALAEEMPILGFIGDQAALYDLNSLPLLKKSKYPAVLLISNNFGGGVFHHLPVSSDPDFETFWAGSHSFTFQKAAEMFSLPYHAFDNIKNAFSQTSMIELQTHRDKNHEYRKSFKNRLQNFH